MLTDAATVSSLIFADRRLSMASSGPSLGDDVVVIIGDEVEAMRWWPLPPGVPRTGSHHRGVGGLLACKRAGALA